MLWLLGQGFCGVDVYRRTLTHGGASFEVSTT
jgi:hypothetical protein